LQEAAPWKVVEHDKAQAHKILTTGLYIGKICFGLLKPVLPSAARVMEGMLHDGEELSFTTVLKPFPEGSLLRPYQHLFTRITEESIKNLLDDSQGNKSMDEAKSSAIDINDFMKVDLRAAKVISAKAVEGSDKLIACSLDLGPLGTRQVFSGVRPHITPEELVGKMVVLVMNLAPRKMRFGTSEGMILAAGEDKPSLVLADDAKPGERVR